MQPTATVDKGDLIRLDRALMAVASTARGGVANAIRYGMILSAQSAAVATPQAKNRKSRSIKRMSKKRREQIGAPWWAQYEMDFWANGQKRTIFVSNKRWVDKLRTPKWKGAAKSGWWGGLRKLGKAPTVTRAHLGRVASNASRLQTKKDRGELIEATLTNRIKYISKIAPNSASIGIQKAANKIRNRLRARADRQIKKAFRTATRQIVRMA